MNLRIKTHSLPGDVSKHTKEAMLEGVPKDEYKYLQGFVTGFVKALRAVEGR